MMPVPLRGSCGEGVRQAAPDATVKTEAFWSRRPYLRTRRFAIEEMEYGH